jgi:hypothetical protein
MQVKGQEKMKLAYVAGPYRARTIVGIVVNILRARKVANKLWKMGYAVICPHSNSALFDGAAPVQNFLQGDLQMLKLCEVIVLVPGWERSSGTWDEVAYAVNNNILIRYWPADKELLKL